MVKFSKSRVWDKVLEGSIHVWACQYMGQPTRDRQKHRQTDRHKAIASTVLAQSHAVHLVQ